MSGGGIMNTGWSPKELYPGLNKIFGDEYAEHVAEYLWLFDKNMSTRNYEEDLSISTFGLVPIKTEGASIMYDAMKQLYVSRYTHVTYGLGFIITREAQEDNLYMDIGKKGARALAFSYNQTRENILHNVFNNGFSSSYLGGDGVALFSTAHPIAGSTFSNILSPGADISEAALEDIVNLVESAVDNAGLKISLKAQSLHVPFQLQFDAKRILGDKDRPATADRDINAMVHMGMFPAGFKVHHYFTDPDAYFVKTNIKEGMRYFERRAAGFEDDNDFDTENMKFKCTGRYSGYWSDPRAFYGSQGA